MSEMSRHGDIATKDDSIAVAARQIHALVCGCADDDWCDSIYLVAAERAIETFHLAEHRRAQADIARAFARPHRWNR